MTTVSMSLVSGEKCQIVKTVGVEFKVFFDEDPIVGPRVKGRMEMTVLKPICINALGAFFAIQNVVKERTDLDTTEKKKPGSNKGNEFQTRRSAFAYTTWKEHCNVFDVHKPEKITGQRSGQVVKGMMVSGTYTYPICFDLRTVGSIQDFEYKSPRGEASIQNRVHIFIAWEEGGHFTLYSPGQAVTLPNYPIVDKNWEEPIQKSCVLTKGSKPVAEFILTLNQRAFRFGESIEFMVEKSERFPKVRAREVSVSLIRTITAWTTGPSKFSGVYCYRDWKKILLEKKFLGSKTFRDNVSRWEGAIVLPEGPAHATNMLVECTYRMELTVNIFGEVASFQDSIPIQTRAASAGEELANNEDDDDIHVQIGLPSKLYGSCLSLDEISLASLPPNYSSLSSRSSSFQTLPPAYSELDLDQMPGPSSKR